MSTRMWVMMWMREHKDPGHHPKLWTEMPLVEGRVVDTDMVRGGGFITEIWPCL